MEINSYEMFICSELFTGTFPFNISEHGLDINDHGCAGSLVHKHIVWRVNDSTHIFVQQSESSLHCEEVLLIT